MRYLPDDEPAGNIFDRVGEAWEFVGGLYPIPKWDLACPACHTRDVQIKGMKFFEQPLARTISYRCDVAFKCRFCSMVWLHGVPITDEQMMAVGPGDLRWHEIRNRINSLQRGEVVIPSGS